MKNHNELTVEELAEKIAKREEQIVNVDAKIARQETHLKTIAASRDELLTHRERWVRQNTRDAARIEELNALPTTTPDN